MVRAHYYNVPFENLDIKIGVPIVVDLEHNFGKIVERERGGWCLELTSLFAWALREIGFHVSLLGGRVLSPSGTLPPPNSHMVALVHLEEPWVVDVGFGSKNIGPIRLHERSPQVIEGKTYVIADDRDHYFQTALDPSVSPSAPRTYIFTLEERELNDFTPACDWLQRSPKSNFTQGDIATLPLSDGRVTYSGGHLHVVRGDHQYSREVSSSDRPKVLAKWFNIKV